MSNEHLQADSSSNEEQFYPSHNNANDKQELPYIHLQKIILEEIQKDELDLCKNNRLSDDVLERLEQIREEIQELDESAGFQARITLRMKELAYSKILVLTYEKSYFRLVQAYFHIGQQYLHFKCFEQANSHLQNALNKNLQHNRTLPFNLYHACILVAFGFCLLGEQKWLDAKEVFEKASVLQEDCLKEGREVDSVERFLGLAKVYAKLGKKEEALQQIQKSIQNAKKLHGQTSKIYAEALYEKSVLLAQSKQVLSAIQIILKAIEALKMSTNSSNEETLSKWYQQLSHLYEANANYPAQIQSLYSRFKILEATYGNSDKKVIKQQRGLATVLLKHGRYSECLEELEQILEKQMKVYGQNSVEVGKEMKTIASVHIARGEEREADTLLKKALKIFHDLGDQKLVRETRLKLSSLKDIPKQ